MKKIKTKERKCAVTKKKARFCQPQAQTHPTQAGGPEEHTCGVSRVHGHQAADGEFRNSYNVVRGKVDDITGGAMESPPEIHRAETQNQVRDRSRESEKRRES